MLEANARVLMELEPSVAGHVDLDSVVDARVTVEQGARIINSVVRGPTIIGENTRIENSYIGPYTSIYHDVVIENSELERCIVLDNSQLCDVPARIQDSLIGRYVSVKHSTRKPTALKMNLGDHSRIWMP
jgi:glucose-1-phosphate thymidylyltransferase